jgi:hypothetical protein
MEATERVEPDVPVEGARVFSVRAAFSTARGGLR